MDGRPFGQYRLLTLIGRGGMGEVWRAHDINTDRVVALKVLPPHLADDEIFQKRFRREARMAAGLYEPHVVPIHGYGEIDGHLYVDMRLIVGEDLETMLSRGPLDPSRAVAIIEQVASALQAAHRDGLIHRDVKPSNILVTENDFAYLIDFGIAHTAGATGLTNTGSTVGTWAYMAPERFSAGDPDPRSDVYALACVLHQMLTGQRPFPGDSVEQQVAGHLSAPPPRPSELNPRVPRVFDDVVANGMAKNVEQRYSTATELAAASRAALDGSPATVPVNEKGPTQLAPTPPVIAPFAATQSAATQRRNVVEVSSTPPQSTRPERTSWWRRPSRILPVAAGIVAVAVVAGLVIAQSGEKDTDASAAATGPTFDGTFTTNYGPATSFSGKPEGRSIGTVTWVVRSFCDRNGCVASSTTVLEPIQTFSFDYIDGRWIAVSEATDEDCDDATNQRWRVYKLEPQPDGSLTGEYLSMHKNGCNSRIPVTMTRVGDADPGVQLADPAKLPPRVPSPAQGFRGRYHGLQQFPTMPTANKEVDYTIETACLRRGERCLSFPYDSTANLPMVFADNQWISDYDSDTKCTDGQNAPLHHHAVYPLPQPAPDPLPVVTGAGHVKVFGACPGDFDFTMTFNRTGD